MQIHERREKSRQPDYQEIRNIAETSYTLTALRQGKKRKNIHAEGVCWFICPDLADRLQHVGYNAWMIHHDLDSKYGFDEDFEHEFIYIGSTVIDPTWQQMLEAPRDDLPKVLIAPKELLEKTLKAYGVPEKYHHIWLDEI